METVSAAIVIIAARLNATIQNIKLGTLRTHLMSPDLCKTFCAEDIKHPNAIGRQHNSSLARYKQEFEALHVERKKIVKSILDGVPGDLLKDDAVRIQNRKEELERLLENAQAASPIFHPNMSLRYHEEVQRLIEALNTEEHRTEAAELIRTLIDKIVLSPNEDRTELIIDLHGDLAGILTMATGKPSDEIKTHIGTTHPDSEKAAKPELSLDDKNFAIKQDKLVAGEVSQLTLRDLFRSSQVELGAGVGFEPTTFRL